MTGGSRPLDRMIPDGQGLEDQPADGFGRLAGIQPVEGDRGSDGAPDLPLNQAERWCSRALEARRMLSAYVLVQTEVGRAGPLKRSGLLTACSGPMTSPVPTTSSPGSGRPAWTSRRAGRSSHQSGERHHPHPDLYGDPPTTEPPGAARRASIQACRPVIVGWRIGRNLRSSRRLISGAVPGCLLELEGRFRCLGGHSGRPGPQARGPARARPGPGQL
jgi:hypothetical protein